RGHAVRGVAHEERAAAAEALRELRGEGEAADPQDLRLQVCDARGEPDQAGEGLLRELLELPRARLPAHAVDPTVASAGGQERARGLWVANVVDAVAMCSGHVPERGAKEHGCGMHEPAWTVHGDAEL